MKRKRSTVVLVGSGRCCWAAGVLNCRIPASQHPKSRGGGPPGNPSFPLRDCVTRFRLERTAKLWCLKKERRRNGNDSQQKPRRRTGCCAYLLSRLKYRLPCKGTMHPRSEDFGYQTRRTVTVTLEDGTEHRLLLGGPDFSGNARYAVIDPETWPPAADATEEIAVLVVSEDVANGINRPVEEWKQPVEAAVEEESADTVEGEATEEPEEDEAADPPAPEEPEEPEEDEEDEEDEAADPAAPEEPEAADPAAPEATDTPEAEATPAADAPEEEGDTTAE